MASIQVKNGKYYVQFLLNGKRKTKRTGLVVSQKNEAVVLKLKKDIER